MAEIETKCIYVLLLSGWFTLPVENSGMLFSLVLSTLYISKWQLWVFFFGMGGGYLIFDSNIVKSVNLNVVLSLFSSAKSFS